MKFKILPEKNWKAVEKIVKHILHASRDCLRNQGQNTLKISFSAYDSYYAEAFGVLRGLVALKYGYFGSSNLNAIEERSGLDPRQNLKWWFDSILSEEVLKEEGFYSDHRCEHCLKYYGKDDKKLEDEGFFLKIEREQERKDKNKFWERAYECLSK